MEHLPILPIILPMLAGVLLLLPPVQNSIQKQRLFGLAACGAVVVVAVLLMMKSQVSGTMLYVLGDWQPPFGIVLVADRLAALMVALTAVLAFGALLYACGGDDQGGRFFHPLFMFQLMGINGAFLTGDIFNLFVFFEVLLIASYGLLIHGGGKHKTRAGLHYVTLNLIGSTLFLFALGMLYGTTGTLNIADMAIKITQLDAAERALAKAGGMLLLLVFGLKAAMLPLHFWLPRTYSAAAAPVAALFAVMTKVGIYSILRVHTVIFGAGAGELAHIALPWLWPLALLTLVVGAIGALASPGLRILTANLVVVSVGTLLIAVALQTPEATAAALYYMVHTTLISGALFLLADLIWEQRGKAEDRFVLARRMRQPVAVGIAFFIAAMAVVGLPPLSGFVGKLMLLQSTVAWPTIGWIWPLLLLSGLAALIALSRAGTSLFWRCHGDPLPGEPIAGIKLAAVYLLLAASPLLVIFGGPMVEYSQAAADQLHDRSQSVYALLPEGYEP
ncbi:monovalent cation/H+ antiporter subunit D [Hahella sp. CCB-MM4]|uniref:monovalent cation/H+ antiporter subunit D n=1 Tax=Hahella sp. (strain CCB-MM4) TaxID=1926491 RepID=UPI000BD9994A|nr:monovalent cation/H+ antiporter subunit D [Hahella sp. CCB-MM4]OZG73043.1 monovalent cation/H+ antiporter subunit D [Hahella sp. CCB-MM4]